MKIKIKKLTEKKCVKRKYPDAENTRREHTQRTHAENTRREHQQDSPMPNKKQKHSIEHRHHHGPRRAEFVASLGRTKQLIDNYRSDCSDWNDAADGTTEYATPPPPAAVPAPAKAPEPAFEFTDFTKLIRFLKECAIRYISTITKARLKLEMSEISITVTKNSVERHASEYERFKVTFAICLEETHKLPEDLREFFESTHCNRPIEMITHDNLTTKRVRIYSLAVDGFGRDIYIASDTAVNNFLLKMKSFHDNQKQFVLPSQEIASASPITVEDCLDGLVDDDALDTVTVAAAEFGDISQLWG